MVHAFDHLAKGTFADNLNQLITVSDMIILFNTIVAFFIIVAIVN